MKKSIILVLLAAMLLAAFSSVFAADDVIILFTNDVHCATDGYTRLVEAKNYYESKFGKVVLVDAGDHIQGDVIGAVSKGEYIIDYMNEAGYEYVVLGNHEFDYGMDRLAELAGMANFQYVDCNLTYDGAGETKLGFLVPYAIKEFDNMKIAFVGVSTPHTIASSTPTYFQEDGEFVYGFSAGEKGAILYAKVQETIDAARADGADYVILLTHLGIEEGDEPYRSIDVINNTNGVNAVIDGHSHSVIPQMMIANKDGDLVLLTSTGTKFASIGVMEICGETGNIISTLLSGDINNNADYDAATAAIFSQYEEKVNEVVATTDTALNITDETGIRMVRSRETNLGDLCADAYAAIGGAQIGMVNGGGVRANIDEGDITFAEVIAVHPFGNMLTVVKATGQQIIDALEWTSRNTQADYNDGADNAVGECGGFLQVSGLKYTIDTSVESAAVSDANGMFFGMVEDAPYRVKDVQVLVDGEYVAIDPEAEYTVASHNYLLKSGGDGTNMFQGDEILVDEAMSDYQVLLTYITDVLGGKLGDYAEPAGRITVE